MTHPKHLPDDRARGVEVSLLRARDPNGLGDHPASTAPTTGSVGLGDATHPLAPPAPRLLITVWWAVAAAVSIGLWTAGYWVVTRYAPQKAKVSRVAHAVSASTAPALPSAGAISPSH